MKISRTVIRIISLILFFVIVTLLSGKICGFLAVSDFMETGEQTVLLRSDRRIMDIPAYLVPDDGMNSDHNDQCYDSDKKKLRIQLSHLIFLDSLFHMFLYPILLFSIIIRLFGKNLHVLLWRIISYIHVRDDGEYYISLSVVF